MNIFISLSELFHNEHILLLYLGKTMWFEFFNHFEGRYKDSAERKLDIDSVHFMNGTEFLSL